MIFEPNHIRASQKHYYLYLNSLTILDTNDCYLLQNQLRFEKKRNCGNYVMITTKTLYLYVS